MIKVSQKSILVPWQQFLKNQASAGLLLLSAALVALFWANSPWQHFYHSLWEIPFSLRWGSQELSISLHHWINDGLMAMFFFVIGLELKREVISGHLSSLRKALLPLGAALGGMVVPALIFVAFNHDYPDQTGWGIPMATDIAFALGILALIGKRIPAALKIFITALAMADDLGAVIVIALFYTSHIDLFSLITGIGFLVVLVIANRLGVRATLFYAVIGIGGIWSAFLSSGIHASIAGVLIALAIPARTRVDEDTYTQRLQFLTAQFSRSSSPKDSLLEPHQVHILAKIQSLTQEADTPLQRLERAIGPFVLFFVMPLFAFANAGIDLRIAVSTGIHSVTLGVFFGLLMGKLIGIVGITKLMVWLKWASWPPKLNFRHLVGAGFLSGVGFTMSMFITTLAYGNMTLANFAKVGILMASLIAGLVGFLVLRFIPTGKEGALQSEKSAEERSKDERLVPQL